MVQSKSKLLVLFYDQAQRIYSPTPAIGAMPIHRVLMGTRSMQTAEIADMGTGVPLTLVDSWRIHAP
jgi:hypothetical protein